MYCYIKHGHYKNQENYKIIMKDAFVCVRNRNICNGQHETVKKSKHYNYIITTIKKKINVNKIKKMFSNSVTV